MFISKILNCLIPLRTLATPMVWVIGSLVVDEASVLLAPGVTVALVVGSTTDMAALEPSVLS